MQKSRWKFHNSATFAVLLGLVLSSSRVFACASCGSGGDNPIVMYPNETTKFYMSAIGTTGISSLGSDGEEIVETGPVEKRSLMGAVGQRVARDVYVAGVLPYMTNVSASKREVSDFSDPLVSLHWNVVTQKITQAHIPQVQLIGAYKKSMARSISEVEDPEQLDVFGTGYDEKRAGFDIWWGMNSVKGGTSLLVSDSEPRQIEGYHKKPGRRWRWVGTGAWNVFQSAWTGITGLVIDKSEELERDGERVDDSDSLNHSLFLTINYDFAPLKAVRVSGIRSAAVGANKNAVASSTVSVALIWAI